MTQPPRPTPKPIADELLDHAIGGTTVLPASHAPSGRAPGYIGETEKN